MHRPTMIKSAFHVEESQFRDNEFVKVQLSIRPKSYEEYCNYQQIKIRSLESEIHELRQIKEEQKEYIALSDHDDEEEKYHPPQLRYNDIEDQIVDYNYQHYVSG